MKTRLRITIMAVCLYALASPAIELEELRGNVGGRPGWWWAALQSDVIAVVRIDYDPTRYFTIGTPGEKTSVQYYIEGTATFERIVYANSASPYVEALDNMRTHTNAPQRILIHASRLVAMSGPPPKDEITLRPVSSFSQRVPFLAGMNMVYLFPVHHLILEAAVPDEKKPEIEELVLKRKHNMAVTQQKAEPTGSRDGVPAAHDP